MADISAVTLPDNTTYGIKDSTLTTVVENLQETTITEIQSVNTEQNSRITDLEVAVAALGGDSDNQTVIEINNRLTELETDTGVGMTYNGTAWVDNYTEAPLVDRIDGLDTTVSTISSKYTVDTTNDTAEVLGNSGTSVTVSDEITFTQNGDEVASIADGELSATAVSTDTMKVGKWAFIKRSNDNLTLKWLGGDSE